MSRHIEGTVTASDGTKIAYRIDGPEGAPWIILSNSLATDMRVWDPQLDQLSADRQVLRYDTRGHGRSDAAVPPYSFDQLTGDVLALCAALSIDRADFMGISLGGMTGLALALRQPGLITRLVCADARADAPAPYKAIWDGNIERLHAGGVAAICDGTLERWFTADFSADPANASMLDMVRDMILTTAPQGYEGAARCLQQLDLLRHLSAITCPTLYVVGEFDPAASQAVMQEMADQTKGATLTVVPGAAHLSNLEQPAAYNAAIRDFLRL